MITSLVVTIIGPDRPDLVRLLSDKASAFGANWAESRLANLAGQFAGIVRFQVPIAKVDSLVAALRELEALDLHINISKNGGKPAEASNRLLSVELIGQDRPGIVREIASTLADRSISMEELDTELISGSWSGESLFQAKAKLRVPTRIETAELCHILEGLANELMVDVSLENDRPVGMLT